MLKEATPKPSTTAVPSTVVPFLNVTLPGVGVNPVGEVMVAVNVTLVFTAAVVAEELRAMTVVALFTSSVKMGELLARCVASPLYTAVSERVPPVREVAPVVSLASADPLRAAVPRLKVPDLKVTLPVGVSAVDEVTCATSCNGVP